MRTIMTVVMLIVFGSAASLAQNSPLGPRITNGGEPRVTRTDELYPQPKDLSQITPAGTFTLSATPSGNFNLVANRASADKVVTAIGELMGYNVVFGRDAQGLEDRPTSPVSIEVYDQHAAIVLSSILGNRGYRYEWVPRLKQLNIFRQGTLWEKGKPTPPPSAWSREKTPAEVRAEMDAQRAERLAQARPRSGIFGRELTPAEVQAEMDAQRAERLAQARPRSGIFGRELTPAEVRAEMEAERQVRTRFGTSYSRTWHGVPYYDMFYEDMSKRLDFAWSSGFVKFKGRKRGKDEKFLERVSVVALVTDKNGVQHQYNIIDAAEGNNKWDRDVRVPLEADGSANLIFVLEDGSERPRAFGRRVLVTPVAISAKALPIIVQYEQLETARMRYSMRVHHFEEDASGQIKRK